MFIAAHCGPLTMYCRLVLVLTKLKMGRKICGSVVPKGEPNRLELSGLRPGSDWRYRSAPLRSSPKRADRPATIATIASCGQRNLGECERSTPLVERTYLAGLRLTGVPGGD
jgi:hypothetical protein